MIMLLNLICHIVFQADSESEIYPSICYIKEGSIAISYIMFSLHFNSINMLLSVHPRYNITISPLLYLKNILTLLIQTLDALVSFLWTPRNRVYILQLY